MNNSNLTFNSATEPEREDVIPLLRQRETELMEVITALENINSSQYWKMVQLKVFRPDLDLLKKKLQEEEDTVQMFRLQGRVKEASKYDDLSKLILMKRNELQGVRQQLNGKNN